MTSGTGDAANEQSFDGELIEGAHPNLRRQLRRAGIVAGRPIEPAALMALLQRVDRTYRENELTRYTLERALDISTIEMRSYRHRLEQHTEEQLAVENDRRRSVISALDHGLVAINSDDEVLFVNEAAIALLGGEPDSGTDVLARFSLKDPRSGELLTIEQLWRDLTDGEDITGTVGYLCSRHGHTATANTSAAKINAADINAGRDRRPVRASITPLVEGTKITGMVLLFDDSTERNETMESLARALREAQRAAEAKSQFLANMSHEIRTPMNGVLGMLELVAHTELDHQQRHWISVARTSGDALLDIINEILDFSRLEAGRTELEKVDFDPARVADDVMSLLGPRAQANGLAVSVVHGVDLPRRVVGDPGRIRQVLVNFVGNAIKFTRHGSVRLLVDRIDPPTSRRPHGDGTTLTQTTPTQTTLRFVVEDTGVGIPSDRLDDLFAPFNQLDVSTTRTFGGTGLGLSICRETVKLMEGNIAVASQIGVGSSFAFTVPVGLAPGKNDEPGLADDDATMASGGEVPHLLVAEDNTINQILIKAILDHMGVTYEMVTDGRQAVEAALERPFTAVLMDCQMPVLDGFDASRRLRAAGSTVPILALTANALAGDRERCLDAGMTDYLAKPLKMDHLRRALAKLSDDRALDGRGVGQ